MIRLFSIVVGLVLLLPGACGLAFLPAVFDSGGAALLFLVVPGLLLGALGVWFIFKGGRNKRSDHEPS